MCNIQVGTRDRDLNSHGSFNYLTHHGTLYNIRCYRLYSAQFQQANKWGGKGSPSKFYQTALTYSELTHPIHNNSLYESRKEFLEGTILALI